MEPVKIFYCCTNADEDKDLRDLLNKHLMSLKRLKQITMCLTREILAGANRNLQHDERLQTADLILPLISPDFINSDYHHDIEMQDVLARHRAGNVIVIPILLRRTYIQGMPFEQFQMLPRDGKSLKEYPDHDLACFEIIGEISEIVKDFLRRKYDFLSMADTQILPNGSSIVDSCCATCGEQNEPGRSICSNCWDLLYTDDALAFSPPPAPTVGAGNAVICPKCGRSNRPGAKFCYKDGQPLSASNPAHPVVAQAGSVPPVSLQIGPAPQVALQAGPSQPIVPAFQPSSSPQKRPQYDSDVTRWLVTNETMLDKWPDKGPVRSGKGAFERLGNAYMLKRNSVGISMMYVPAPLQSMQTKIPSKASFKDFIFEVEVTFLPSPTKSRGGIVFRARDDSYNKGYYYFSLCTDQTCALDFIEKNKSLPLAGGNVSLDFSGPIKMKGTIEGAKMTFTVNSLQLPPVVDTCCSNGWIGIAIGDLRNDYYSEVRFRYFTVEKL